MISSSTDVLIVGGGPTGLLLGVELARREIPFRIIEKSGSETRQGRAIGIHARTLEIFDDLGVLPLCLQMGRRLEALNTYVDGKLAQRIELGGEPVEGVPHPEVLMLEQNVIEAVLSQQLAQRGVEVRKSTSFVSLTSDSQSITAVLKSPQGEEEVVCKYLVGCDGAHSRVREAARIGFEGSAYPAIYLLADVEVDWAMAHNESYTFHRGDQFLTFSPLQSPNRFRLWTKELVFRELLTADVRHGLLDLGPSPPLAMLSEVAERLVSEPIRLHSCRFISRCWISKRIAARYRKGRVLLAGDAAHVHAPSGHMGMNTGLQDAYNLGWKLAFQLQRGVSAPLDSYHEERRAVGLEVLRRTDAAMTAEESRPLRVGESHWRRSEPVSGWAQLDVSYRGGPLSLEKLGEDAVQAGDRAPDATLLDGDTEIRLFELFRGTQWTLLVFLKDESEEAWLEQLESSGVSHRLEVHALVRDQGPEHALSNPDGGAFEAYGIEGSGAVLVRPDGYIGFRATLQEAPALLKAIVG